MKNTKKLLLIALALLTFSVFYRCTKNEDSTFTLLGTESYKTSIQNTTSLKVLSLMNETGLLDLDTLIYYDNKGKDLVPPNIEGSFMMDTCELAASNGNDDAVKEQLQRSIRFDNQHNGVCRFFTNEREQAICIDTIQLIGWDSLFIAYFDQKVQLSNTDEFRKHVIVKGVIETDSLGNKIGIRDINYGWIVTDRTEGENNGIDTIGTIKIFKDRQDFADTITWEPMVEPNKL